MIVAVVFLPHIKPHTCDFNASRLPFALRIQQRPIVLTFTIYKSQGQGFDVLKYMSINPYSAKDIYMLFSRCGSKINLKIQNS